MLIHRPSPCYGVMRVVHRPEQSKRQLSELFEVKEEGNDVELQRLGFAACLVLAMLSTCVCTRWKLTTIHSRI